MPSYLCRPSILHRISIVKDLPAVSFSDNMVQVLCIATVLSSIPGANQQVDVWESPPKPLPQEDVGMRPLVISGLFLICHYFLRNRRLFKLHQPPESIKRAAIAPFQGYL